MWVFVSIFVSGVTAKYEVPELVELATKLNIPNIYVLRRLFTILWEESLCAYRQFLMVTVWPGKPEEAIEDWKDDVDYSSIMDMSKKSAANNRHGISG